MAKYKTKRRARYWDLRNAHFAPIEAREFSKLTRKYPALQEMVEQRAVLWKSHERKSKARGWSITKEDNEWVNTLKEFYAEKRYKVKTDRKAGTSELVVVNWVVRKDVHGNTIEPTPSPWDWYDSVFQLLPDQLKWDTPRSHRATGDQGVVNIDKVQTQRWIDDLKKSIAHTDDPVRKAQFRAQMARLKKSIK